MRRLHFAQPCGTYVPMCTRIGDPTSPAARTRENARLTVLRGRDTLLRRGGTIDPGGHRQLREAAGPGSLP